MPPTQPNNGFGPVNTTPPSLGPEPYDFIRNYGTNKQRVPLLSGTSLKNRILIVVGGVMVLLLLVWVFAAIVSRASNASAAALIALAQRQTELARISQQPVQRATAAATQTFAVTTQLSLLTDQQTFVSFLSHHGISVSAKTLQATANAQTDAALQTAQTAGTYDQTYISIAQSELTSYEQALKQTYTSAKNLSERQLLSQAYDNAKLLSQQSSQTE